MEYEEIRSLISAQKAYYASGKTLDVSYRLESLRKLKTLILENEKAIVSALRADFGKPEFEVLATETRFVLKELNHTIRNLRRWARARKVYTPLVHFLSFSRVLPQPYGQVLILSPWNFPFQLTFLPLVGAIAAGNCAIIKVSRQVPETSAVMEKILEAFPRDHIAFMNGDHSVSEYLLNQQFDYIFFTGSTKIGRYVMQKAAGNLTPVSLELGGKNPCVVAADARLEYAAKRIAWGKFLNGGQTCICPDYVLVDRRVKDKFLEHITHAVKEFFGDDPASGGNFARVISSAAAERLELLMKCGKVITGGIADRKSRYVAPTVLADVSTDDPVMREEIFGPVLPIVEFSDFEDVYRIISKYPAPLATYIFSRNRRLINEFIARTKAGTAGINDTVMQIASPYLPYGGLGLSGLGRYHGKKSFETFSNMRSILEKSNLFDVPVRYAPYTRFKISIIKLLMR